jgi:hypothetical protein
MNWTLMLCGMVVFMLAGLVVIETLPSPKPRVMTIILPEGAGTRPIAISPHSVIYTSDSDATWYNATDEIRYVTYENGVFRAARVERAHD